MTEEKIYIILKKNSHPCEGHENFNYDDAAREIFEEFEKEEQQMLFYTKIDKSLNWHCKDLLYDDFYKCPNCQHSNVFYSEQCIIDIIQDAINTNKILVEMQNK